VVEVTDAMVAAYLQANTAYWQRADEQPTKLGKWRNGTPSEATRESLRAVFELLAAAPAAPAAAKSVSESRDIQNHMMVIACQAAQGEHASGKAMLRAVTKALAGDQNLMRKIIAKHAPAAAHPLSVLQYNAIPALQAIPPSLFESVVRGVERAFCAKNGITLAGAAGATGEQRGDE
jgi:hypothetical protein